MDVSLSELREMVMDTEAWSAVIHGVTKSRTRLSDRTELNWILESKNCWDLNFEPRPPVDCLFHNLIFWAKILQIRSDQLLSHVQLFVTPWITALQASLSITNSPSSLKLMSIESVMPSSHLILCRPLLRLFSYLLTVKQYDNKEHGMFLFIFWWLLLCILKWIDNFK